MENALDGSRHLCGLTSPNPKASCSVSVVGNLSSLRSSGMGGLLTPIVCISRRTSPGLPPCSGLVLLRNQARLYCGAWDSRETPTGDNQSRDGCAALA